VAALVSSETEWQRRREAGYDWIERTQSPTGFREAIESVLRAANVKPGG
jgi:hypothetical protein